MATKLISIRNKNYKNKFLDKLQKDRKAWVGTQEDFNYKLTKRNKVLFCNISGNPILVNYKTYNRLIKEYGSRENLQKFFVSNPFRKLKEQYGTAWLYMHKTPKFGALRLKLQLLMRWFNKKNAPTDFDLRVLREKTDKIKNKFFINRIDIIVDYSCMKIAGMWLKNIPFVYDIYISPFITKHQFNLVYEKIVDESPNQHMLEERYDI